MTPGMPNGVQVAVCIDDPVVVAAVLNSALSGGEMTLSAEIEFLLPHTPSVKLGRSDNIAHGLRRTSEPGAPGESAPMTVFAAAAFLWVDLRFAA